MSIRIQVRGRHVAATKSILRNATALGIGGLTECSISLVYFLAEDPGAESVERLCTFLLVDPVTESISDPEIATARHIIEVAPRPGVTDVEARELARGMAEIGLPTCEVATATRYELQGDLTTAELNRLARQLLCNETIQHYTLGTLEPQFGAETAASDRVETVPIADLDDQALLEVSRTRLLSLDLTEMRAIQEFYAEVARDPSDVELETLAQTWSEHCVHKTFRARIDFTWQDQNGETIANQEVDGLLNSYIRAATEKVHPAWLRSAFVDDAGIVAFDDTHDLAFKAETHNHPSALEPFGGANTGVGGVVRDILGVSARPIATTDSLCFGPQDFPLDQLPEGVLHPRRIADGVVAGIADYGNKLGLPTVNGAIIYDSGYLGNPLVFCGCVGLLPSGSHPTEARVGDQVVVLGGRTGRDGLHGATFSSAELTHDTAETTGSAVQIGDPITEKGLIELVESARDRQLYTAITDCGAGGLSSSIGEMGEALGVDIELTHAPLKYPGLMPWEIWLSEAQERMVMAVPPRKLAELQEVADLWDVEMSVLGVFTGDRHLRVRYAGHIVADLPMAFLHDGLPRRHMQAVHREPATDANRAAIKSDWGDILLEMLTHPSVASKEEVVRRYDHEVRGGTLVRPFVGPAMDGPADAAVLKPLGTWHHNMACALSVGINPLLGMRDPYAMAVSAVDEAMRNVVAVGADPDQVSLLDNFCWGNPTYADRLGALVRACQGCYDAAVSFGAPFISGKDSLFNEFNGKPIPGTLLISALAIVPDMQQLATSDLKQTGNLIYLLGDSRAELGGSLLHVLYGGVGVTAPTLPAGLLQRYRRLHQAIRQGLVQACHDLSEGGLAVSMAEMALAGRKGADIEIPDDDLDPLFWLFGESNGRLLLEVKPEDAEGLESQLAGQPVYRLGQVTDELELIVRRRQAPLIQLPVNRLLGAWKREGL